MTSTSVNSILTNWQQRRSDQLWLPVESTQSGGFDYPSIGVVSTRANAEAAGLRLLPWERSGGSIACIKQRIQLDTVMVKHT